MKALSAYLSSAHLHVPYLLEKLHLLTLQTAPEWISSILPKKFGILSACWYDFTYIHCMIFFFCLFHSMFACLICFYFYVKGMLWPYTIRKIGKSNWISQMHWKHITLLCREIWIRWKMSSDWIHWRQSLYNRR